MFKAWKIFCIMSLLLITMVFAGCGNDGDKFVGSWTGLENPNDPLSDIRNITIEKKDNNFIVKDKYGFYIVDGPFKWQDGITQSTATLKDGILVMGSTTITYNDKDGTLLYKGNSSGSFSLQKDDDNKKYQELKNEAEPLAKEKSKKNAEKARQLFWK